MTPSFAAKALAARKLAIGTAGRPLRAALNALMPPRCPVTGEAVAAPGDLDPAGWASLHFIEDPVCPHCGVPFAADYGEAVICPSCIAAPPVFDRARAAIVFNDEGAPLVSAFKFSDRTELAALFAKWMARAGKDLIGPETLLVPVPLHWRRLAARRFNQSALLAGAIGAAAGAAVALRALERIRATPPQRQTPSAAARQRNVAGAFAARREYAQALKGAHVVLIDDVLTSGATMNACARALKHAGAARVDALVLARVVKGGVGAI